ncbi:twin-arginine translocation signal domain-containing protein [Streptomyces cinnamoneus]|uniref:twin-arginine translocation signal domain-containing protein n=1 Tax=Streptomyces cinnamoneus TaxID=53446 RepID=UPI00341CDD84
MISSREPGARQHPGHDESTDPTRRSFLTRSLGVTVAAAGLATGGLPLSPGEAAGREAQAGPLIPAAPSTCCALTPDRLRAYRYNGSGTSWSQISRVPIVRLFGGQLGLLATMPPHGEVFRLRMAFENPDGLGAAWDRIGGPGAMFAVTAEGFYGLTPTRNAVYRYDGTGTSWTQVGTGASRIFGGTWGLVANDPTTGALFQYLGSPHKWRQIGTEGATFAVTDESVYGLTPDQKRVYRYDGDGMNWTRIGNDAQQLYGGDWGLVATDPGGNIWRYLGSPHRWQAIGGPGAMFAVAHDTVYGLTPRRDGVYRYSGSGTFWTVAGGPADMIVTSSRVFAGSPGSVHPLAVSPHL